MAESVAPAGDRSRSAGLPFAAIDRHRLLKDAAVLLGAAAGYFICAVIGTVLSVPPSGFAIIWPATAFLVSIFLITGPRQWLLATAGVIPTHFYLAAIFQPMAPFEVVLTQIGGNLLLVWTTVAAVRFALGRRPRFDTLYSVLVFMLIAAVAVPMAANSVILAIHLATDWISDFWLAWRQWLIAVIFPTVTIPPLVSLAANYRLTGSTPESPHADQELALLILLLFAFTYVAYSGGVQVAHWPVLFLVPFPFLLWAAVRLGVGGTCLSLLVFAVAIVLRALHHHGPFAMNSPIEDVVSLQTYLVTTSVPLILLAALMDERREAERRLHLSDARMRAVTAETGTGLWQWDCRTSALWLTPNCRDLLGLSPNSEIGLESVLDAVAKEDRHRLREAINSAVIAGADPPAGEYRVRRDGQWRWLILHMNPELDRDGRVLRVSGAFRDVTERKHAQLEADRLRLKIVRLREDERRRISEDLHDSTAQHLVAAGLGLANLKLKLPPGETRDMLCTAMQSVRDATQEIRTLSYLLHPPQLGQVGLRAVLHDYVPGFQSRTGVHTSLRLSPLIDRLPTAHQHAILRIAQESLGNVHRHAKAENVWINVRCIAGNVHVIVQDDGKGIETDAGQKLGDRLQLGMGIPAMAARVKRLKGRFDMNSRMNRTTIHVTLPLSPSAETTLH